MRRYLKEFQEDYVVINGVVQARPLLDETTHRKA